MKKVTTKDGIIIGEWEAGETIDLRHLGSDTREMRPVEFHVKKDGAVTPDGRDIPSLAIVMDSPLTGEKVLGQISFAMLAPAMKMITRIAYEEMLVKAGIVPQGFGDINLSDEEIPPKGEVH